MEKYYKAFKEIVGNRDIVFNTILNHFDKKPLSILEIGCARNLNLDSRKGDGWSSCFWADYVNSNGGWVDIYDISEESIKNCRKIINYWLDKQYLNRSVTIHLKNKICEDFRDYNLIFLDGGDDPKETLDQFENTGNAVVLVDDFHTKGRLLPTPDTLWTWPNGHQMAAYGIKKGSIQLENIEK